MIEVIATGSGSPCLDLSRVSKALCEASKDVDLCIIEGMGRAIHTNIQATFKCDSVKIAVFKNPFLASKYSLKIYDGMVLFEKPNKS